MNKHPSKKQRAARAVFTKKVRAAAAQKKQHPNMTMQAAVAAQYVPTSGRAASQPVTKSRKPRK